MTSPRSDLKGAPNRRRAVVEFSSLISQLTCSAMSSLFRSGRRFCVSLALAICYWVKMGHAQCSCFPVSDWPGGGRLDLLLLDRTGRSVDATVLPLAGLLAPELEDMVGGLF